MQQRLYPAEAIVLRRIPVGETDRILTLFTREKGKLSAIAKGSRRPLSRLAGGTEPFVHTRVLLAVGQNLDVLTQCQVESAYPALRKDLTRIAYATYFTELVDAGIAERQPQPEVWDLLVASLAALETTPVPDALARAVEMKLLDLLGYAPELEACVLDRAPLGREIGFHPLRGGVVCGRCARRTPGSVALSPPGRAALRALRVVPLQEAGRAIPTLELRRELARCLIPFVRQRLEAALRSLAFLEAVSSPEINADDGHSPPATATAPYTAQEPRSES